jgi:enoyl-CoA hydratase
MGYETVLYDVRGAVARRTLNRPGRRHAINAKMLGEIDAALAAAETDEAVRAVVVTGAGTAFSSGFDLKEQAERKPSGVGDWRPILRRDFDTVMRFWHLSKPTIAAVRGHCLAGACELMLACDVTVAGEGAVFGEPELRFGAGIVVLLLPWLVGPKRAKHLLFTGEDAIDARRAEALGLVNEVVPDGEVLDRALAVAASLTRIDPMVLRQTKRAINRSYEIMGMGEALEAALDIDLQIEGEGSIDKREFMEIARKEGLRAAIAWRDRRFGKRTN